MRKHTLYIFSLLICWLLGSPGAEAAYPAAAESSALASGKWVKVNVEETGIQFLSASFLKSLGFADPSKVHVYGYGGRIISEVLDEWQRDDLPQVPVVRTDGGILFFGHSNLRWTYSRTGSATHEFNPYDNNSYYFLSDREAEERSAEVKSNPLIPAESLGYFTQYLVHEQDLAPPHNTGRTMLGEDFRTQSTRTFNFALPGFIGDASATVKFAAKCSSGTSSLTFSANGKLLGNGTPDNIGPVTAPETFMRAITTSKSIPAEYIANNTLDLSIKFTAGGALSMARLDYIVVNYKRELRLPASKQLCFQIPEQTDLKGVRIKGCSDRTRVWDITDSENPVEIPVTLSGDEVSFVPLSADFAEYVAFEPGATTLAVKAGTAVENQDLHSLPVPDMLIISPAEYISQARRIAELHAENDGMLCHVVTPEALYNEFSCGSADVSAFRKALKMWYDRGEQEGHLMQYCLIMSRPTYDQKMITEAVRNAGYPRVPIWQSPGGTTENTSYSADSFIGMLDDSPNGVFYIDTAPMRVAVARMPVKSLQEATEQVDKLIAYVNQPDLGDWRNKVMLIADDQDNNAHIQQAESIHEKMRATEGGSAFLYDRLYLDAYPLASSGTGMTYSEPRRLLQKAFNDGVMFIDYIGHASPRGWGHEGLLRWQDIVSMNNPRWPIVYAATCEFARWDSDVVSGGERMWLYPDAGVIAMIATSRSVYIADNGALNDSMSKSLFDRSTSRNGVKRLGDILRDAHNGITRSDDNKLRYMVIGDPAMPIPYPRLQVKIDAIGDVELDSAEDLPVIPALGRVKVSGRILNPDGTLADDFNGIVAPTLYDAERVIETYGNGDKGVPYLYNDHKNMLYTGKALVKEGLWEATILMPSEIDNNYSPALLALYAHSDDKREAHGATTDLYVYGFSEEGIVDDRGPEIKSFYINNEAIGEDSPVGTSIVVNATVEDESGIFIADTGIGHRMTLTIDGREVYKDVSDYYEPSDSNPCEGSFSYLISDIEPGSHTLELLVWDNANNSARKTIDFKVKAGMSPSIYELTTDVSPASTSVLFTLVHDHPAETLGTTIEVFDLGGCKVWSKTVSSTSGLGSNVSVRWNLTDSAGRRVPRGIYIYRATVETSEGRTGTKSKKLAVTAP